MHPRKSPVDAATTAGDSRRAQVTPPLEKETRRLNLKDLIPIPHLRQAKNVLVIYPHPDDAELVAGGTIALLTGDGAAVTYAAATDGDMGTFDPGVPPAQIAAVRRQEQQEAASLLGVRKVEWLGFHDCFLPEVGVLRRSMVKVIRQVKPDFVITLDPWLPYESHPDHRKTAMAAVEAATFSAFPLAYPEDIQEGLMPWQVTGVAMALSTRPNTFINIEPTWEKKIQACLCHKSQFPPDQWSGLYMPYLQAKSAEWGHEIGASAAEAFKVLHPYHLHTIVDAWRM